MLPARKRTGQPITGSSNTDTAGGCACLGARKHADTPGQK